MVKVTLIILIRLWHLPMIDYEMQVEGENQGRGFIIFQRRSTSNRGLRIILMGPGRESRGGRYAGTRIGVCAKKDRDQAVGRNFGVFSISFSFVAWE
jgi:hypothetical protein